MKYIKITIGILGIIFLFALFFVFCSSATSVNFGEYNNQNGHIRNLRATWLQAHSGTTGESTAQDRWFTSGMFYGNYYCYRSYFFFDTSSIPDGAIIDSVSVNYTIYGIEGSGNKIIYMCDTTSSTGNRPSTSLATDDFYLTYYDKKIGETAIITTTGRKNDTLSNFTSFINKTGITRFMAMDYSHDYLNSTPTGIDRLEIRDEEKMRLWITYHTLNAPTISLQFPTNSSTAISLKPILRIWANDSEGDLLNITWQTNYSGSYVTKQVNTSFIANTTCRWFFYDCTIQFKKYYWRVYVNDGTYNITKWFCFTTALINMYVKYSNIPYANNSIVNYTYNFTVLSDRLDNFHKYLNLSFTKNSTVGFNTTTKLYFDKTLLNTWTFINGSKTVDIFNTISHIHNGTKYTWSINTTYYNLSYNISYNFTFEILFDNLNISGNPNSTGLWLYLGAMLTLDNGQFFLLILIGLWSYFIYLYYKEEEVIFTFCIICCGLPLGIILSGVAYYNSYPFGYLISFILILISFLIPTYGMYKKNKAKNKK